MRNDSHPLEFAESKNVRANNAERCWRHHKNAAAADPFHSAFGALVIETAILGRQ